MEPECSQIAACLEKKVCLPPHNDPTNQGFGVADPLQCWHMYDEDINWWKYKNYSEMPVCLETRMVWKLHQRNLSHRISSLGGLKSWPPFSWTELTASLVHTLPCSAPGSCPCCSQVACFPRVTSTPVSSHHAISSRARSISETLKDTRLRWKQAGKCDRSLRLCVGYSQGIGSYTS